MYLFLRPKKSLRVNVSMYSRYHAYSKVTARESIDGINNICEYFEAWPIVDMYLPRYVHSKVTACEESYCM